MALALQGIRVLDLSTTVAGDFSARLMADYGADVVKVEPTEGSPVRRLEPFAAGAVAPENSLVFWHLNLNKKSIAIQTGSSEGEALVGRLAASSHIVVTTDRRSPAELGLQNEPVVLCRVTDLGEAGGISPWSSSEMLLQAAGGSMFATGLPGREPLFGVGHRSQLLAGTYTYFAALAALFSRPQESTLVEVSSLESVVSALCCFTTMYEYNGHIADRAGTGTPRALLQCRDGWVMLYIYDRWRDLCEILGAEALMEDPRFATQEKRYLNWPAASEALQHYCQQVSVDDFVSKAQAKRIAATRVRMPKDVLDSAHLRVRGFWRDVEVEDRLRRFPGLPFRLSRNMGGRSVQPPALGQHTDGILMSSGYSRSDIARLKSDKVVR